MVQSVCLSVSTNPSVTLRHYLYLMVFGTLLCWAAWLIVLFNIDPRASGGIGLASFLVSLFLGLLGTFALLGFLFRRAFLRSAVAFDHIGVSVRQGMLLALVLVLALALKATGLYAWWVLVFLVAGISLLESFFLTRSS